MTTEIVIAQTIKTEPTPELVARMFCAMDDGQQAQFFSECAKIENEWRQEWEANGRRVFFLSGYQWYAIGKELAKRGMSDDGTEALMAMAAPLYLHTMEYAHALSRRAA